MEGVRTAAFLSGTPLRYSAETIVSRLRCVPLISERRASLASAPRESRIASPATREVSAAAEIVVGKPRLAPVDLRYGQERNQPLPG